MTSAPVTSAAAGSDTALALEGGVERITFYNPHNGFTVLRLRVRGHREPVTVVGTLPEVQPGEVLSLTGRWHIDPQHGAQFQPDQAEIHPPAALDDLVRYLGSGLIRHLGPVLAQRIVTTFGEQTLEILDTAPERVRDVSGIGPQRARALAAAWKEHRALRAVSRFLSEHRLHTGFAPRLVRAYGEAAPRVLAANPYRLVADVPGLGFAAADRLGQALGIRATSPARLQAAVQATLLRASEQGHTRLSHQELLTRAAALAQVEPALVTPAVAQLLAGEILSAGTSGSPPRGTVDPADASPPPASHARNDDEELLSLREVQTTLVSGGGAAPRAGASSRVRIYEPAAVSLAEPASAPARAAPLGIGLAGLVQAEETLVGRLLQLASRGSLNAPAVVDRWLARSAEARALSDEQRDAVRRAATSTVFVLTGGPGVGKTTTVRALVACLRALGRSVALAAPTGKAAKRLGAVVGAGAGAPEGPEALEARTIHRLLGAGPNGFRHGWAAPLPYDAVILDEASMLDTRLARAVVSAIGPRTQLILVGDADQLPSVGPGQVLRDVLASGRLPSGTLTTVFRQAAQSQIIRNAHLIRQGVVPPVAPATALGQEADCVFVPASAARVAEVAAQWAARRLPSLLGVSGSEIQVLAPLTRVTQSVNGLLQQRLNPPRGQPERPHGALPLRTGDRVIQTRNNYTLGVFNGDTGSITALEPKEVTVDFGDGRVIAYAPADLLDLEHAYCLTVHRAQGSEWPGVVLLVSSSYGPMLTRNLLYTALTRARRAAVLVGDLAGIARAVADTRDQARSTALAALLQRTGSAADGTAGVGAVGAVGAEWLEGGTDPDRSAAPAPGPRRGRATADLPDLPLGQHPAGER